MSDPHELQHRQSQSGGQSHTQQVQANEQQLGQPIEQIGSSNSTATLYYAFAPAADSFDIASNKSEGTGSEANPNDDEADDAFWWSELYDNDAPQSQASGSKRPGSLSDEGGGPAKRRKPG